MAYSCLVLWWHCLALVWRCCWHHKMSLEVFTPILFFVLRVWGGFILIPCMFAEFPTMPSGPEHVCLEVLFYCFSLCIGLFRLFIFFWFSHDRLHVSRNLCIYSMLSMCMLVYNCSYVFITSLTFPSITLNLRLPFLNSLRCKVRLSLWGHILNVNIYCYKLLS